MAREGLVLSSFYSASPVCGPSRQAWVSGRFPADRGVNFHNNPAGVLEDEYRGVAQFLDPRTTPTVYSLLNQSGWSVSMYGKWSIGGGKVAGLDDFRDPSCRDSETDKNWIPHPGFYGVQHHRTFSGNDEYGDPCTPTLLEGCAHPENWDNCSAWFSVASELVANYTLAAARAAIALHKPFYVQASFHAVHETQAPSPAQIERYGVGCGGIAKETESGQHSCARQVYVTAQQDTDFHIGRVLDWARGFERSPAAKGRTVLAIFSSDNGPEAPEVYIDAVGYTGPFRGRKRSLYDGGIRMPTIVRWPGVVLENRVDETPLGAVDWFPTIAFLAGVKHLLTPAQLAKLDGEDMSPILLASEQRTRLNRTRPLFWEWRGAIDGPCWHQSPQLAVRQDRWKLLMDPDGDRLELYDMWSLQEPGAAPPEYDNVRATQPDVVAKLSKMLLDWKGSLDPENTTWTVSKPGCAAYPFP
jgi:N-acetylgalactosamine-6-sulfatase